MGWKHLFSEEAMKKVLVIDDMDDTHRCVRSILPTKPKGKFMLLNAHTLQEGESLFQEHPDVALIVMDGCVDSGKLDSVPLVKKIRETYQGPILATSSSPTYNDELVQAGCSDKIQGFGSFIPKVKKILGIK